MLRAFGVTDKGRVRSTNEDCFAIDAELGLLVSPIVLGSGKRLFENGGSPVGLKLVGSTTLSNGVLSLTYGLADA